MDLGPNKSFTPFDNLSHYSHSILLCGGFTARELVIALFFLSFLVVPGFLGISNRFLDGVFTLASHQVQWLNPAAWTAAPGNAFGNAGVGQVELPSLQQVDLTFTKAFVITERVNFKFQADAFNVLNHCNYSSLGTTATSGSSFGRLSGAYPNKQLPMGAKVTF
jgi:hypothetical protein